MNVQEKISHLAELGNRLRDSSLLESKISDAANKNPWYTEPFVRRAVDSIIGEMLDVGKLQKWLSAYQMRKVDKTVGLIFAGNIPLVGFHDFLCCYVTGCRMKIKLSSKDDELFPAILNELQRIDSELGASVQLVDTLKGFDAVIATGSDNTNRSFDYYFRNYARILRKNRNSVAILQGGESPEDLRGLSDDIFLYFGLGCRNVSKLYLPVGYDFTTLFPSFESYAWLHNHNRYLHNYDYNRTILLLNKVPHFSNDFVMLAENPSVASPVSTVYFEYWHDEELLKTRLRQNGDKIQCVVSATPQKWPFASSVRFGQTQNPELWDYADGVDTIQFLLNLKSFSGNSAIVN